VSGLKQVAIKFNVEKVDVAAEVDVEVGADSGRGKEFRKVGRHHLKRSLKSRLLKIER
jgi:hypothetical protein